MTVLVTGASGYVGAALVPRLQALELPVRAFARDPARVTATGVRDVEVATGDAVTGAGLDAALDGVDVAYFLIHSMETAAAGDGFATRERVAAENFARAAQAAGVRRVVYLGGLVPAHGGASAHLASRLAVEQTLLQAAPEALALRASIVVGARSRSFRFLVRLVERVPLMPLPAWRDHRTQPIDGRDVLAFLVAGARSDAVRAAGGPLSLDIAGPDVVTYGELVQRIRDALLVARAPVRLGFNLTPVASRVAAAIAGEDHALIGPLMEGLEGDLLPRDDRAAALLGVRLHRLDAAIERALREWEAVEELRAR
jgi:uncharacterized protein YbjT (DUF2867 family)